MPSLGLCRPIRRRHAARPGILVSSWLLIAFIACAMSLAGAVGVPHPAYAADNTSAPPATVRLLQSGDAWIGEMAPVVPIVERGTEVGPGNGAANASAGDRSLVLGSASIEYVIHLDGDEQLVSERVHGVGESGRAPAVDVLAAPAIAYEMADGELRTAASLRHVGHQEVQEPGGALALTVSLEDPDTGLRVERRYRIWPGTPAVEHSTSLVNVGTDPLRLRRADSLGLALPANVPGVGWLAAIATADTGFHHHAVTTDRRLVIDAPAGSGVPEDTIPSFVITQTPAQGGLFGGLVWSSNYRIELVQRPDGGAAVQGGEAFTERILRPGERFDVPPAFAGVYEGDLDSAARALQRYASVRRSASSPLADGPPVTWNSWFAYERNVDEQRLMAEADIAASLGIEVFYVDHGWQRAIGDWHARPDRFTNGSLATLAGYVHARGMRFGAWVAFGVVDPDSPIAREHPEWLATAPPAGAPKPIDGAQLLCLAPARAWILAELERAIVDYRLDWIKLDQAMIGSCAPEHADPAQIEASVRENTLAFYDILRTLRARHPNLVIENCYDGGGYLDYALYGLTDVAWLTDAAGHPSTTPVMLQQAFAGATRGLPPYYLTVWLARQPDDDRGDLEYRALSTMGGAWGLSMRLADTSPEQREWLRQLIDRYKRLRPFIAGGELYHLSDPHDEGWLALAYVMPARTHAAVLVVRNDAAGAPRQALELPIPGLMRDTSYRIAVDGVSQSAAGLPDVISGARLLGAGLSVALGGREGAIIYLSPASPLPQATPVSLAPAA